MIIRVLDLRKKIRGKAYEYPNKERAELEATLDGLIRQEIHQKHLKVITFQKRMIKYKNYLFTFLYHQDVRPDNNKSEQAICNIKVKQKISGMFKSIKGAQNYAIISSITDTCN